MGLSRRPAFLLLREYLPPVPPADAAYLYARDDGAGVTKVSYRTAVTTVDIAQPAGGGTSNPDAEYINVIRDFNAAGTGLVNDAPAINNALSSPSSAGSIVYLPRGVYRIDSPLIVPSGRHLMGTSLVHEGTFAQPNDCRIFCNASMARAIDVDTSASVSNLTVDGGTLAAATVLASGSATGLSHLQIRGGTNYSLKAADSTERQRWDHLYIDGDGHPDTSVFMITSTDHLVDSVYIKNGGPGSRTMSVNGNTGMFSNIHSEANANQTEALTLGAEGGHGSQNMFSACFFQGGGPSGDGVISIRGDSGNQFSGCVSRRAYPGKPSIGIRASKGNIFMGWVYTDDIGAGGTATQIVKFYNGAGAPASGTAAVVGTRIYWSSDNCAKSGGEFTNLSTPSAGDGIDIVGYASGLYGGDIGNINWRT